MAEARVYTMAGEEVGSVKLPDEMFAMGVSTHVLWEVVRAEQANRRQGNASALTRAEVTGSGRKPWRQKHTGHARAGSFKSPIWRSGGVAHGPKPRAYTKKINRKVRRKAIAGILSERLSEGNLRVIRDLTVQGKTREVREMLGGNGLTGRKTVILTNGDSMVARAAGNIPGVFAVSAGTVPVSTLVNSEVVVIAENALDQLKARVM
ncbi:MAG TPA: 50S ribosomal protein L4 [Candidatus Sabulitectum sp.]|nr:50S ribosomal protein L4 [Candidatus Sabulitectum sp.]HPF31523.1 50S ribosomal protein L4 [Candidatus Sabulitectum sp.]HPJ27944.1 50S ribosomal protein L4 [Candidatus Sabulitectum sp.]HPR21747.1 50S ribosomal protein L4 [Candidatus Sabulitectum sp.]